MGFFAGLVCFRDAFLVHFLAADGTAVGLLMACNRCVTAAGSGGGVAQPAVETTSRRVNVRATRMSSIHLGQWSLDGIDAWFG